MSNLDNNKTIIELKKSVELGLAEGFFGVGKALYIIKQQKLYNKFSDSFSGFCKKFPKLPGNNEESKRLTAFKMVKIYSELYLGRGLSQKDILELGFNKAYDLSGFSSTHSDKEFLAMLKEAKSLSSTQFRKLLTGQYSDAVRKEIITKYYNKENKLIGSNTREIKL